MNAHLKSRGSVTSALLVSWLLMSGCTGSGPSSPPAAPDVPLTGRIQILLTDAPIDNVDQVHVWITGIATQPRGGPVLSFNKELGDVELLSLRGRTIEIVDAEVPAGVYEFVAFQIDARRSSIRESGMTKPLDIPDGEVRVVGPFEVKGGGRTTITLDFDAAQSLVQRPDGSWSMRPVVVVAAVTGS